MEVRAELNSRQLASLIRALEGMGKHITGEIWSAIGQSIIAKARPYPPASMANSPANPSGRWYERGFGTRYASGAEYPTSENLGRRWGMRLLQGGVMVLNTASYAIQVQGDEQKPYHAARGWKVLYDVAEAELPEIVRKMEVQLRRIWEAQ